MNKRRIEHNKKVLKELFPDRADFEIEEYAKNLERSKYWRRERK